MSEWRELTWDDAMQRGYEALSHGEALYDEIDAEQGRSNIDIEKHLRRAELKVAHVAQALNDLDGVESAEDLAGPYDVIARIQAPGLDQLGRLVASRIQAVDGVTRTLTCTVIHR